MKKTVFTPEMPRGLEAVGLETLDQGQKLIVIVYPP
jgi:hypothetical protein